MQKLIKRKCNKILADCASEIDTSSEVVTFYEFEYF